MAQVFYVVEAVDVNPGVNAAWTDVDCSAYIPAGATGAILRVAWGANTIWSIRKNGSTDDRKPPTPGEAHTWAIIGVDANRVFEYYGPPSTSLTLELVGYTTDGVVLFTNFTDKSIGSTAAWTDVDCSSEAPDAVGLIMQPYGGGSAYSMGLRKNGSTDDRYKYVQYYGCYSFVLGCDAGQVIENKISNTAADLYLEGYVTSGATFNTNATDISMGDTSWGDCVTLADDSVLAFVEITSSSYNYYFGFRPDGSASTTTGSARYHSFAIPDCDDTTYIIEGRTENTGQDFFLIGYATALTLTPISVGDGSITPTGAFVKKPKKPLAGAVTIAGTIAKLPKKYLSGSMAISATLKKLTKKPLLSGSVAIAATLKKKTIFSFSGEVTVAGALVPIRRCLVTAGEGAIAIAATLVKKTKKPLSGSVAISATLTKKIFKSFSGTVSITGSAVRKIFLAVGAGAIALSGLFSKILGKPVGSGAVTISGSISRKIYLHLSGAITPTATLVKKTFISMSGAISTITGSLVKKMPKATGDGSIAISGSFSKLPKKYLSGVITPTATLSRKMFKLLSGAITPTGGLKKLTIKEVFSGTVAISATLTKKTILYLSGVVTPTGSLRVLLLRLISITALFHKNYRQVSVDAKQYRDTTIDCKAYRDVDLMIRGG